MANDKELKLGIDEQKAIINALLIGLDSYGEIEGGFKSQLQQLMFSSDFSELYIMQELSVDFYR